MTSLRSELRKLRPTPLGRRRKIVRIGARLLLVTWWDEFSTVCRGTVIPLVPWHFDGIFEGFPIQTIATFKISHRGTEYESHEVQNISVVDKHQRKGWGSSLVLALAKVFPAQKWWVSGPNEKSTALFDSLAARFPEAIHPAGERS